MLRWLGKRKKCRLGLAGVQQLLGGIYVGQRWFQSNLFSRRLGRRRPRWNFVRPEIRRRDPRIPLEKSR